MVITHTTLADGTFSPTGAIAWNADHTIDAEALRTILGINLGIPGVDGQDGTDGFPGPAGADGAAGTVGLTGPPGYPGSDGDDGAIGPPGAGGTNGANGLNGSTGAIGADGEDGRDGLTQSPLNFSGDTTTFLRGDNTFSVPTASVADPNPQSYTPGSFTVPTGKYVITSKRIQLTGTQRITLQGTARWRHT